MTETGGLRRLDWGLAAGALVLLGVLAADVVSGLQLAIGFGVGAVVAAVTTSWQRTLMLASAAVALAALSGTWHHTLGTAQWWVRILLCAAVCAVSVLSAALRTRREERLRRMTIIAETAQRAVLRSMPASVGSLGLACRYVSASAEALVGGDLYEVAATPFGVRVIIGDVRGKGLDAVQTAASVLASFRQLAFSEPDPAAVARAIDAVLSRLTDDEEFVTALVAQFTDDGTVSLANAGHHPPLLYAPDGRADLVDTGEPSLPLGLGAAPALVSRCWPQGARMLFYTDGLIEARDRRGEYFPLAAVSELPAGTPIDAALDVLVERLLRFTGRQLGDDMALVLAENQLS